MNKALTIIVVCIALSSVTAALAQDMAGSPAPPPAPAPPPELAEAFGYFEGHWRCETRIAAGTLDPNAPELIGKSKAHFKQVEKGWYFEGTFELARTKTIPGFEASFLISYQPADELFVVVGSDDMGGALFETASPFVGDTITFEGEGFMFGRRIRARDTMIRVPDRGMVHRHEVDLGSGFQVVNEDTCTR